MLARPTGAPLQLVLRAMVVMTVAATVAEGSWSLTAGSALSPDGRKLLDRLDDRGRRYKDVASFAQTYLPLLDEDCDGRVPIRHLIEIAEVNANDPNAVEWVFEFDADDDGWIRSDEVAAGIRWGVDDWTDKVMATDANLDGRVSQREYTLAVTDVGAESMLNETLSPKWSFFFSRMDLNQDGFLVTEEVVDSTLASHLGQYWSYHVRARLRTLDADRNGVLAQLEIDRALAAVGAGPMRKPGKWHALLRQSPAGLPQAAAQTGTGDDLSIPMRGLMRRLRMAGFDSVKWRTAVETPVRALLVPACSRVR